MSRNEIANCWQTIDSWLQKKIPDLYKSLSGPASMSEIEILERKLSVRLPDDFKASLEIHNGQFVESTLVDFHYLLSVDGIISEWNIWKGLLDSGEFSGISINNEGVKSDWWNPRWIPFTSDGFGNNLCIDLDPPEDAINGQIVTLFHDDENRSILFPSYKEWLCFFASSLSDDTEYDPSLGLSIDNRVRE